ncbi:MAG TPA: type II toxin-antitoxin system VapC family toxin [Terracidiphilus sp.]|nr:type II toxin-antitoxin system VapC family toxin [Terracidiphilus sp.]
MEILYLLDTNTVSYYIAGNPPKVRERLDSVGLQKTAISTITEAELRYGVARNPNAARRRASVESFLRNASIQPWDSAAARAYGLLRAEQERKGRPLSTEDLMIAAHALSLGLTLVTNDSAFSFVDGLKNEDWTVA